MAVPTHPCIRYTHTHRQHQRVSSVTQHMHRSVRSRCATSLRIGQCSPAYTTATRRASDVGGTCSPSLKSKLRTRDVALRLRTRDGMHRICFCSSSRLLSETIRRHDLLRRTHRHARFLELVGTQLSWNNLLAAQYDHEERVEMRFTGDEATIVSEALALGECRCYIAAEHNATAPSTEEQEEQEKEHTESLCAGRAAFGLRVNRVRYHQSKPFSSRTAARLEEVCVGEELSQSGADADADALHDRPPLSLAIPGIAYHPSMSYDGARAAALASYFTHNMTLHAYSMMRVSDGVVPVVALYTGIDADKLSAAPIVHHDKDDDHASSDVGSCHADTLKEGRACDRNHNKNCNSRSACSAPHAIGDDYIQHSFGVLVTPLAAGTAAERKLWRLQRALVLASALPYYAPAVAQRSACANDRCTDASHVMRTGKMSEWCELDASVRQGMAELLARAHGRVARPSSCQDILSLVTGDYEGAYVVAQAARQYAHDPAEVAALVEPLRARLGVEDVRLELEQTERPARTPLDFMCRCSRTGVMQTLAQSVRLRQPTEQQRRSMEQENYFRCTFCAKVHRLTPEEWARVWTGKA